ncbi:hypothetical protein [Micromonospora sp. WMMD737]|uniref:hypothetical protein n=1 Tax=Micromonospora sp. WMMD737 TaxID=3404113 RepID=UPI003B929AFD
MADHVAASVDEDDPRVVAEVVASVELVDRAVVERIVAAIEVCDPPTLTVAGRGRGWWPVAFTDDEVTVRRHGEVETVPWSSVSLDG